MRHLARRLLSRYTLPAAPRKPRPPFKPAVEALEDRVVPDGRPLPFPVIAAGPGAGAGLVRLFDAETGAPLLNLLPYEETFRGGIRVALGDVTGDGYPEVVTAPGKGGGPRVRAFNGKTGEPLPGPLGSFFAYDPLFTGGVFVAAGDVTGDGRADVVTTADAGGGPHVRVFDGKTGGEVASFYVFEESFKGGANVAVGDLTGDKRAELVLGAGVGGGPRVRVLDGATFAPITGPLGDFFAFDEAERGGVTVAVGDVTGDGKLDVVAGPGKDHAPRVKVFDGASGAVAWDQKVFDKGMDNGVRVGTAYVDDDAFADVVVGTGKGADPRVRTFSGKTGAVMTGPVGDFDPGVGSKRSGVNIAAANDPPPGVSGIGFGGDTGESPYGEHAGSTTFEFYRDPNSDLSVPLTVSYAISGTATNGADYETISSSVTFGPDESQAYVTITPINDTEVEGLETITLTLQAGSGYTITSSFPSTVTIFDDDEPVLPPLLAPQPTCPPGVVSPPPGRQGAAQGPSQTTANPIRYFDGVAVISASDLESDAWGQTRSWSSHSGYSDNRTGGNGWVLGFQPRLIWSADAVVLVPDASTAYYYDGQGTRDNYGNYPTYEPRFYDQAHLSYKSMTDTFYFTQGTGEVLVFNGFGGSRPKPERGMLKSRTDAAGTVTQVVATDADGRATEVQRATTTGGTTVTESYLTTYLTSGINTGRTWTTTLRRKVDSGAWATVRKVTYDYYTSGETGGTPGDLRRATVTDASDAVIDQSYYRYYTSLTSTGYYGGMKYAFGPEAYARLKAAVGGTDADVVAASDATVAPYLDNYFEYGTGGVTKEIAAGAGCSMCSAGQGEYTYAYTQSSNEEGVNYWWKKTVETLPGGGTNTVYTNKYAQVLLEVHTDAANQKWATYYRYDDAGRLVLQANPSAVTGYNEAYQDLVNYVSSNAQYLSDTSGLVTTFDYADETTANSLYRGDIEGYLTGTAIRQGETGTDVPQEGWTYFKREYGDAVTTPIGSHTVYRNDNGTGGQTTTYSYAWRTGTVQAESITTTLPTVTTAQNGPNADTSTVTVTDAYGRPVWYKDADGFISYTAYDNATGAVVKTIADVDTTLTGDFANLPSGWSTPSGGGLHLKTLYEVDHLGRVMKLTAPNGRVDYAVYNDAAHEVRYYSGWNTSTNLPTGPISVTREDRAGGYTETLTMSATPTVSSGRPTGAETIGSLESLTRTYRNLAGQVTHTDRYFNLTGMTYSAAANIGTLNTNYYRMTQDYTHQGWMNRQVSAAGTITRTESDSLGRAKSVWVGTDDTPTSGFWSTSNLTGTNMAKVAEYEYDSGGVGDGNVTKVTQIPGGSAANRVTQTFYDWRSRAVAVKSGVETTESTSVNRPIQYVDYDNLGNVTKTRLYDGDGVAITSTNGVPNAPSSSLLRAQTTTSYDEWGRAYRSEDYSVEPASGSVGSYTLQSNTWFDRRGQVIKTSSPGGLVQKVSYDGAGRTTASYTTDGGGDSGWSDADDVTGDIVLLQDETTYDASGLVLLATHRERFHDATDTGALGTPTSPTGVARARASYLGYYYDLADRPTATSEVGTNGGSAWTRPSSVPSRSDTVLVTSISYDSAGMTSEIADPRGLVARRLYDDLGRTTKTIENYVDGTVGDADDKTTEYAYGPAGMTSLTAKLTGGGGQTTEWAYGVTTGGGSGVNSNDVVGTTKWPDPSTGSASASEQETVLVNALGQPLVTTDRNGTVHTLTYDVLGRVVADAVTTLGSGVDGAVRRAETAFDGQGNAYLLTTYDAASGGSVVTQVQRQFNGLGQLTREWQSHSGAVNTSTTPSVQYAYSEMPSGANHSRLTSVTYPNGFVLTYNYSSGLNGSISRLSSLSDSGGTLESYDYLGLGTVVRRSHPTPGVDLTFLGTGPGTGGDQYVGLDAFGRVIDQNWKKGSSSTDRFTYTYDRNGNRLTKGNAVNSAFDESYAYDGLNQLTAFTRGSYAQSWDFDALGNWDSVTTNGTPQTRTHNKQNEITGVSGATTPAFDSNGNMTTDETGKQFVYDAWNRLKVVKDSGGTTLKTYAYDALNRRVAEIVGANTTDLYYSAAWQVLEERVNGSGKYRYVWSSVYVDAMVLRDRLDVTERLWAQQDANYNVTALTNESGQVTERYIYGAFGSVAIMDGSWSLLSNSGVGWSYLYQGGRLDSTSGLYSFRSREYSSSLGRWTAADPLGHTTGTYNQYLAYSNMPLSHVDPMGLDDWVPVGKPFEKAIKEIRTYRIGGEVPNSRRLEVIGTSCFLSVKFNRSLEEIETVYAMFQKYQKNDPDEVARLMKEVAELTAKADEAASKATQQRKLRDDLLLAGAILGGAGLAFDQVGKLLVPIPFPAAQAWSWLYRGIGYALKGAGLLFGQRGNAANNRAEALDREAQGYRNQANAIRDRITNGDVKKKFEDRMIEGTQFPRIKLMVDRQQSTTDILFDRPMSDCTKCINPYSINIFPRQNTQETVRLLP